jgi:hypothetical protein
MTLLEKIKDFVIGTPAPEVIVERFVEEPENFPGCLPNEIEASVKQPGDTI